ncbi:MAG: DUF4838 domain-containing protein [Armatimonadota bacterium]
MRMMSLMAAIVMIAPAAAADLVLIDGGESVAVIVAGEDDAEAAAELQTYLLKMTGAELPVADSATTGPRIVLGGLSDAECADLALELDGFVIRREGDALRLAGETPTGTRNAVYRFLDLQGVRWYLPGEVGEVVPERDRLIVGDLEVVERPDYLHRSVWPSLAARGMSVDDRAAFDEWKRRNLYGGVPVHVGHNFRAIAPASEYFEEHPDWYALRNGQRDPAGQLCTSNPEVIAQTVRAAQAHFDEKPEQTMFSLSPDDHVRFCHCPDCEALDPPEFQGLDTGKGRRLMVYANEVAERLQETHPGKNVAFYAYWGAVEAPGDVDAHPNVIVFFTPIGMAFNYPLQDPRSPVNRIHDDWYMGWRNVAEQMGIRHYYNFSSVLWIPWRVLTDELRYQYEHHALYMNAELWSDAEGSQLSYWILARVLWDVDADVDALFDDYVNGLYGPAAEPMRRYYARLTDSFSYGPGELLWPRTLERQRPFLRMLTPEVISASRDDLREARALAAGDETLVARVRISQTWLRFMDAWRTYAARMLGEEPADVQQQAAAAAELINSIERVSRYAPGAMPEIERILLRDAPRLAWLAEGADALAPAFPEMSAASPELPPTQFRGTSRHVIVGAGEPFEVTIRHWRVGSSPDPVRYQIAGPGGTDIRGEVPVGEQKRVRVAPAPEGLYTVLLQGGSNAGSVETDARYLVHDARAGLHVVHHARPLYFSVPAGAREFTLSLAITAPGESVHVAVVNPEGEVAAEGDAIGSGVELAVEVPAGMDGRPWRIELSDAPEGVFEDVERLTLSEGIPPYFTDAPGRLVAED